MTGLGSAWSQPGPTSSKAVWTFVVKVHCELQPLSDANQARTAMAEKIRPPNVEPHGGTPLYPAIANAVDTIVADSAGEDHPTNIVIVLTDGGELHDLDDQILKRTSNRGVKVFVTALNAELCARIRTHLQTYFHPASNCLTVQDGDQADRAQKYIQKQR